MVGTKPYQGFTEKKRLIAELHYLSRLWPRHYSIISKLNIWNFPPCSNKGMLITATVCQVAPLCGLCCKLFLQSPTAQRQKPEHKHPESLFKTKQTDFSDYRQCRSIFHLTGFPPPKGHTGPVTMTPLCSAPRPHLPSPSSSDPAIHSLLHQWQFHASDRLSSRRRNLSAISVLT